MDRAYGEYNNTSTSSGVPRQEGEPVWQAHPQQDLSGVTVRVCPKCGSPYIEYQREQSGTFGVSQNGVTIMEAKKKKGCLYWVLIGWWWKPFYWLCFGWWQLFFGGKRKKGWNLNANKTLNYTIAVCQNCGYSWKV